MQIILDNFKSQHASSQIILGIRLWPQRQLCCNVLLALRISKAVSEVWRPCCVSRLLQWLISSNCFWLLQYINALPLRSDPRDPPLGLWFRHEWYHNVGAESSHSCAKCLRHQRCVAVLIALIGWLFEHSRCADNVCQRGRRSHRQGASRRWLGW